MTQGAQTQPKSLLLIELNEVNRSLLEKATSSLNLSNLKRLLSMQETITFTQDEHESGYLEPWVQWASIHTGVGSSTHRIMHLGDVPNLSVKQLWEELSENGIHSGVWGIMNGSRRNAANCDFFVADPWTACAQPYPDEYRSLTVLAEYIARNYLNLSAFKLVAIGLYYLQGLLAYVGVTYLVRATALLLEGLIRFGPQNMVLGAFFEYTSACAFVKARRKFKPQCSIIFFNLLAHIQHHHWVQPDQLSAQLEYGFKVVDAIVGELLNHVSSDDLILAASGLSQMNTNNEAPWILYRPKDPESFLTAVRVTYNKVDALMTHDAHIWCDSEADALEAFTKLSSSSMLGKKMFYVERDSHNHRKLFYRLEFTDPVDEGCQFVLGGESYEFARFFDRIVQRTGRHQQEGFVFQSERVMPARIENHEMYHYICMFFGLKAGTLESREGTVRNSVPIA